jgi:collagenase-like PrtC family protease
MFSVGTNFDPKLIDLIKHHDVYEIYGKLTNDIIGGCRPSFLLGNINWKILEKEISKAHSNNISFNYLLNSSCLNNIEYTRHGFNKIIKLLDRLKKLNVDSLTVTIPYLAKLIKENFPSFKICVSTLAGVNNIKKYESWKELGVDCITPDISANRNFEFLKYMAKFKKPEIKLMVNQCCETNCIQFNYHTNVNSHHSQKKYASPIEYCVFNCKLRRTNNPSLLLQSCWIRPEDLIYYQNIGINKFKIVQRQDPTEKIVRATKAYANKKYAGNLLDIMNFVYNITQKNTIKNNPLKKFLYFFKPHQLNPFKLLKLSTLLNDNYDLIIDNQKLNGFLKYFLKNNCNNKSCKNCKYCQKWTTKAIKYNNEKREKLLKNYQEINNLFIDKNNSIFK